MKIPYLAFFLGIGPALLGLSGCATARAGLSKDVLFQTGQERLAKTGKQIRDSGASEEEQTLFMQAESFYDYRFGFPERSTGAYLAEIAASTTDFPAFQSLAASLDLAELRLRSYDSAVQLWEEFLKDYPASPLKPLALYRLGWAYRSTGLSGAVPQSGDERFAELEKDAPDSVLGKLSGEARAVAWKSKGQATAWTLIPGMGQAYLGEGASAATHFFVALGALAMILAPAYNAVERRQDLNWKRDWPLLGTGLAGAIVINIDYTQAYEDALRGVVEFNEKQEGIFLSAHPEAP
jgi:hypothetical protein